MWRVSHRADPVARQIADRHYNRQKIGSPQFVPPGRCLVLTATGPSLWVTSWPFAEYVKHEWAGAWVCSAFRREGGALATDMIRCAVAATLHRYGDAPQMGMVTFLDTRKVQPIMRRGKPCWGYTWQRAGWRHVGWTKGGLMTWQLLPEDMPPPMPAIGTDLDLFAQHEMARQAAAECKGETA